MPLPMWFDGSKVRADRATLEALFLSNLPTIERTIRFVCERQRLTKADAQEFASEVKLRFVEKDYDVLRRFEQRSSLPTYLTVVIQRMYLDYCNHRWGKWRPSMAARRMGPVAVRLETLMVRDGFGFAEACTHLRVTERVDIEESDLARLAGSLPIRTRRRIVGESALADLPAEISADESALMTECQSAARRLSDALNAAIAQLPDQDRVILRLRFQEDLSIADIARSLHLESKGLYRRVGALLRQLRQALEAAGISSGEASDLVNRAGIEMGLAALGDPPDPDSRVPVADNVP